MKQGGKGKGKWNGEKSGKFVRNGMKMERQMRSNGIKSEGITEEDRGRSGGTMVGIR